ncbi:MAG: stage III sporulation protein AE [Agathobacter sp.]|nr:stage III sporulation protein AE [Agathobacter sp.]
MGSIEAGESYYIEKLLELLKLDTVDSYLGEHLDGNLSFYELVAQNVENEGKLQGVQNIGKQIWNLFFSELAGGKALLLQMLLLSCLFAFFQRLLVKTDTYVSQMSFFIAYGAVILLMMQSFLLVSTVVESGMSDVTGFLQVLVPAYATTLMLSGNTASAGMFYELMFALIYLLEWALKYMVVPGIHMYVLLELMDHFFTEHKFSKLADLIASIVHLFRKVAIGGVIGISAVQSLLAPARDRISQSAVLKSLSVLPGVGNGFHLAEEVLLGCGMLVKNSVGVAGLVILLLLCMTPVIKVLCFTFLYKIIAAILQPVCDPRILGAVNGVAKGSSMFFNVMADSMMLFLIAIAMVTASTSFIY